MQSPTSPKVIFSPFWYAFGYPPEASGGYPNAYQKGEKITLGDVGDCKLFHAGTQSLNNELVTSGGRVFSLNYQSKTIDDCKKYIYEKISSVDFSNCIHRTDIGDIYES